MVIPLLKNSKSIPVSKWIIGVISIGGVIFLSLSLVRMVGSPSKPSETQLDRYTVPAKLQTLTIEIEASGRVQPIENVNISPKRPGILKQLLVEQGINVQKGQMIAIMENDEIKAEVNQAEAKLQQAQSDLETTLIRLPQQVNQAKARLEQAIARLQQAQSRLAKAQARIPREIEEAKANLLATQARFQLAQTRIERNRPLFEQGAISRDRFDTYVNEYDSSSASLLEAQKHLEKLENTSNPEIEEIKQEILELQAIVSENKFNLQEKEQTLKTEIEQLKAGLTYAKADLKRLKIQYQDTILTAPFSGIVTQKYANEGAFVTPTTSASSTVSATSASILALAKGLEIIVKVPEVDLKYINLGQQVNVIADAYPKDTFQGEVKKIAPEAIIQQNVTSFEVVISLQNGLDKLLSNMNVDVTFIGKKIKNTLVVPTVAIVTENGQKGVRIPDKEQISRFQPVSIGLVLDDRTQILAGLYPNQKVFIQLPPEKNKKPLFLGGK
ncbi:MAG: HlyD family efflux transporter periplasmic adaptor subunit [Xenococcaceae cyanobacterium]